MCSLSKLMLLGCFQNQKEIKLEKISYPLHKIISQEPGNFHEL